MVTGEGMLVDVCFQTSGVRGAEWRSVPAVLNVCFIDELPLGSPGGCQVAPPRSLSPDLLHRMSENDVHIPAHLTSSQVRRVHFAVGETEILGIMEKDR